MAYTPNRPWTDRKRAKSAYRVSAITYMAYALKRGQHTVTDLIVN